MNPNSDIYSSFDMPCGTCGRASGFAQSGVENLGEKRVKPNPKNKHIHLLL
jgi:hypothetical protein